MSSLLIDILQEPQLALGLSNAQYGQLIRQGRSSALLATVALNLETAGILEQIPTQVRRHLVSAISVCKKQFQDLAYEVKWLKQAHAATGEKLVLLKGAAYIQAELPVSCGRFISDVDILVPASGISPVEKSLNDFGWSSGKLDSYNERYYRMWMHEIPPMGHSERGSTIDLHHTILPPTAKSKVKTSLLFEELLEVHPGVFTLSPQDMVIHSATHLFHEGEFHHGLRDLWDLNRMLRDFPAEHSSFWGELVPRAQNLGLVDSLFHGLTYTQQVFHTPVPANVMEQASSRSRKLRSPLMNFLFRRAFRPDQPECRLPLTSFALYVLYVRSHYLRMPLYLLIPHLLRKAWMGRFDGGDNEEERYATADTDSPAAAEKS
jgi:putative nucleotidyltransferase-like protein